MLRLAPLGVLTAVTVTMYVFGGVPAVCPTVPGEPAPPAQPEISSTRNKHAPAPSQAWRRRTAAKLHSIAKARSHNSRGRRASMRPSGGQLCGLGQALPLEGAVVVTVAVIVVGALRIKEFAVVVHVPAGGAPLQVTVTTPLNPPAGVKVIVNVTA